MRATAAAQASNVASAVNIFLTLSNQRLLSRMAMASAHQPRTRHLPSLFGNRANAGSGLGGVYSAVNKYLTLSSEWLLCRVVMASPQPRRANQAPVRAA